MEGERLDQRHAGSRHGRYASTWPKRALTLAIAGEAGASWTADWTVQILTALARFVIVDVTGASVPHEPSATVPHFKIPWSPAFQSARDFHEVSWVLPIVRYDRLPLGRADST